MLSFYTELLKTRSEKKFTDARAALEIAGIKYKVSASSVEGAGMVSMAGGHAMGRPRNPGTNVRPMLEEAANDTEYLLEVRKKDFGKAKVLIG